MSFGIGIRSPVAWVTLEGDDQCGEHARLMLESDTSLPKPPVPEFPPPDPEKWKNFAVPVINVSWPIIDVFDIVRVQPMTASCSEIIKWDFVDENESARRQEATMAELRKELQEGEILKSYCYGEILAERGGWFIVHKDTPHLVRRYCQTWMS